jgi:hypothetical protein
MGAMTWRPREELDSKAALAPTTQGVSVFNSITRALVTAAVILAIPSIAAAQTHQPGADERQLEALFEELQEVHTKLEDIQMQALQDPGLSAEQAQLGEEIQQAMVAHDPTMVDRLARAEALESEAVAAQQSGDTQRLQELMSEAQTIQMQFMALQQEVIAQPAISQRLEAFQVRLEEKMLEVDPAAESLITRFRELEGILSAAMSGA